MSDLVLDLQKGMVLDLKKTMGDSLKTIEVGVNWGKIRKSTSVIKKVGGFLGFGGTTVTEEENVRLVDVDLDLSALLYDANGKLVSKVYFRNLSTTGVKHSGDDLRGDDEQDDSDNETISIDLAGLSQEVTKIVFVLVSFQGQDFADIPYAQINLYNTTSGKKKVANGVADITKDSAFKGKTSMVFAAMEKKNNEWSYRLINEPTSEKRLEGLVPLCYNI